MFPTFPEFIPLSLELKDAYNNMVSALPPYSDISFATLQVWWNLSEQLAVSQLNDNLVIDYHLPFDADQSGLSLIGTNNVDASIETIFEYLRSQTDKVELLHVPEFVVEGIKNKDVLTIEEEHDYNEYILSSAALAQLEGHDYQLLRKKIKRFNREVAEKHLDIRKLDLSLAAIQDQLFQSIAEWEQNSPSNDPEHTEHQALKKTLSHAGALDIKSLALYLDEELHGIMIYHQPLGKEYYILHHLKVNYETPYISDYIHHVVAKEATKNNVAKLNIEMDLGIENLRKHKMTLRPEGFFKKYTISPR